MVRKQISQGYRQTNDNKEKQVHLGEIGKLSVRFALNALRALK